MHLTAYVGGGTHSERWVARTGSAGWHAQGALGGTHSEDAEGVRVVRVRVVVAVPTHASAGCAGLPVRATRRAWHPGVHVGQELYEAGVVAEGVEVGIGAGCGNVVAGFA